jgi:hypothetical protein
MIYTVAMTKQAHVRRLADKQISKAQGKRWGRLFGILKKIHREKAEDFRKVWRYGSEDSRRWLKESA